MRAAASFQRDAPGISPSARRRRPRAAWRKRDEAKNARVGIDELWPYNEAHTDETIYISVAAYRMHAFGTGSILMKIVVAIAFILIPAAWPRHCSS
jgi:hypothetical protein